MAQALELYEQKILKDSEFPIQLHTHSVHKKGCYFDPHWHEHMEMHFVVSGRIRIKLDQEEYAAEQGDLVIANGNVIHSGYCDGSALEDLSMIFEMEAISGELAEKNIIFQPLIQKDRQVAQLSEQIYTELQRQEFGWRQACKGALLQMISYLSRRYAAEMLSDAASVKRLKKLERLNTVNHYIQENYTEPITNAQLAELIHVSEDRFNHLFKEGMGMSPLQYINEIRLKKAMHLLRKGEFTAAQVADAVGFSDYNHFGRMFRRYFGMTPMEARESSRIV